MTSIDLNSARNFAIIFIYTALMGTAAVDKWKSLKTPEWFVKPFEKTVVAKLPGGARLGYWMIATMELALTLAFLASIVNPAVLPFALVGSLFLFGVLCFGLRVTNEYQGSANMFIYFAATLVSLMVIS